jgi:hypothetical protein
LSNEREEISYNISLESEVYMICKLKFSEFDGIVSCSICSANFHIEHLIDWLAERKYCPVCNRNFVDIGIEKY